MGAAIGDLAWHVHHEVFYEKLTEPLQNRIDYVKRDKNQSEVPTRLKLMRPVLEQAALKKADSAYTDSSKAYEAALAKLKKARPGADYDKASVEAEKALEGLRKAGKPVYALHRQECEPDCPWDGVTILPAGGKRYN